MFGNSAKKIVRAVIASVIAVCMIPILIIAMLPSIIFNNLSGSSEDDENFIKKQYEYFEEKLSEEFQKEVASAEKKCGEDAEVLIEGKYDVCRYMAYYSAWYDKKEEALKKANSTIKKKKESSTSEKKETKKEADTTTSSTTTTSTATSTATSATTSTASEQNTKVLPETKQKKMSMRSSQSMGSKISAVKVRRLAANTGGSGTGGSGTGAFSTSTTAKQQTTTAVNSLPSREKKKQKDEAEEKEEKKATDKANIRQFLLFVKDAKLLKVTKRSVKKASTYRISYRGDHAFAEHLKLTKDEIEVCDDQAELLKAFLGDDYNGEVSLEDMGSLEDDWGDYGGFGEEAKDVKKLTQLSDQQMWKLLTGISTSSKPTMSQCGKSRMDKRMTTITVQVWDWKSPGTSSLKKVTKKKKVVVNKALKNFWISFFNAVYMDESKIVLHELGGYNYRMNTSGSSISAHSFGATMDINWSSSVNGYGNGYGQKVCTKSVWSKMKNTQAKYEIIYKGSPLQKIAYKYTLSWGGEWKSVKDPMHISLIGDVSRSELKSRGKGITYYMPGNGAVGKGKKYKLSKSDYAFVCQVVAQECSVNYEGALAVISFMCNQNEVGSSNLKGKGIVGVCKSGWYASYNTGAYRRRIPSKFVKKAVTDAMNGKRNIPICVTEFWAKNYKPRSWGGSAYRFYATIGDNDYYYSTGLRKKYKTQFFAYQKSSK